MENFERKHIGTFEYNLVRQEAKQTRIIQGQDGTIWCYVSSHLKDDEIEYEIQRHSVKIFKAKQSSLIPSLEEKSFVDGEDFQFLGDNYRLKTLSSSHELISFDNEYFYIHEGTKDFYKDVFKEWYIEQGKKHISERVAFFAPQLGVNPKNILVTDLKNKWGACTPTGILKFNWKLMMLAPELVDYVIVHELAHLKHLNHSPAFWAEVEFVLPNYQKHMRSLE